MKFSEYLADVNPMLSFENVCVFFLNGRNHGNRKILDIKPNSL